MQLDPRVKKDWFFGPRYRFDGWTMIDFTWVAQVIAAAIVFGAIWLIALAIKWLL